MRGRRYAVCMREGNLVYTYLLVHVPLVHRRGMNVRRGGRKESKRGIGDTRVD